MFPRGPSGSSWGPRALRGPAGRPAVLALRFGRELQKRPLLAKCIPTAIGFAFGDVLTQYMNRDRRVGLREQWAFHRTASMLAIGALAAGPVLLSFNRWMDIAIMPDSAASPVAVCTKFLLDQVLGCIFWQGAYISINPAYRRSALQLVEHSQRSLQRLSVMAQPAVAAG